MHTMLNDEVVIEFQDKLYLPSELDSAYKLLGSLYDIRAEKISICKVTGTFNKKCDGYLQRVSLLNKDFLVEIPRALLFHTLTRQAVKKVNSRFDDEGKFNGENLNISLSEILSEIGEENVTCQYTV